MMLMKTIALSLLIILGLVAVIAPLPAAEKGITFWTTEVEKDRLSVQEELAREFAGKTGIPVKIVPVDENLLAARVMAAYAARSLPDVLYHPVEFTEGWARAGILDGRSSTEVVNHLGRDTFSPGPLEFVRIRGKDCGAVPLDAWGQLLLFRKDLFTERSLPVPDTWDSILEGARALHDPPRMWGFEVATDPGQTYTQQVFEQFALSNGVRLASKSRDSRQEVWLDTPRMVATLRFYRALSRFTPPGNISWLHARMDYLSGRAAMIIWSPFILDELSGLRGGQPVLPDMKRNDPGYLARNTGFVGVIRGPGGSARYGQINCLGITGDADDAAAGKWVEFLLGQGYLRWLSMAAEGKVPVRTGTRSAPRCFVEGWMNLQLGGITRTTIPRLYGISLAREMIDGVNGLERWGLKRGMGDLVSRIYATKIIPIILKRFLNGEMDARQTARLMNQRVRELLH